MPYFKLQPDVIPDHLNFSSSCQISENFLVGESNLKGREGVFCYVLAVHLSGVKKGWEFVLGAGLWFIIMGWSPSSQPC